MQVKRGANTYKKLLLDETPAATVITKKIAGRNPYLLQKRNDLLLHRVYFKSSIQRKAYDDILIELETEFFLSKSMLQKIIQEQSDVLLQIKRGKPAVKDLREKWKHIIWT